MWQKQKTEKDQKTGALELYMFCNVCFVVFWTSPDIAGLLVGYLHYFMNDNLKPDDAVQLPAAPKKGGRASAPGATKGSRKRGGRKQRVIESY